MPAMVLRSERQGKTVLLGSTSNIDGDIGENATMPATLGDVLIEDISIRITSIATIMLTPEVKGPEIIVLSSGGDILDYVGSEFWKVFASVGVTATIGSIGRPIFLGSSAGEVLRISFAEVDINAVPTADMVVLMRAIRLRS